MELVAHCGSFLLPRAPIPTVLYFPTVNFEGLLEWDPFYHEVNALQSKRPPGQKSAVCGAKYCRVCWLTPPTEKAFRCRSYSRLLAEHGSDLPSSAPLCDNVSGTHGHGQSVLGQEQTPESLLQRIQLDQYAALRAIDA